MEIAYFGHSAFKIKTKTGSVVLDPYDAQMLGKPFPKLEADVVTISHDHGDHNASAVIGGDPLIINLPGEYERKGIRITGFETYHDKNKGEERGRNTMYKIEGEDVSVLHCGDLGHTLSAETIEMIDGVDVLLIPVGGFYTIDAEEARQVVEKLEPSIVIPMHYRNDAFAAAVMEKLAPLEDFLGKLGVTTYEAVPKLTVSPADFEEQTKVVVLSQQS
jgi:L-ascorbate metabolism protein UlaG (beta-lactamase superfamily)